MTRLALIALCMFWVGCATPVTDKDDDEWDFATGGSSPSTGTDGDDGGSSGGGGSTGRRGGGRG